MEKQVANLYLLSSIFRVLANTYKIADDEYVITPSCSVCARELRCKDCPAFDVGSKYGCKPKTRKEWIEFTENLLCKIFGDIEANKKALALIHKLQGDIRRLQLLGPVYNDEFSLQCDLVDDDLIQIYKVME